MARVLKSPIPYQGPATENLIELIRRGLAKHADQTIIIDSQSGRHWRGRELEATISALAGSLRDQCQLKTGDVCTLYGPPNDHFAIIILAVISAGGVSNFCTAKYRPREILDTSKALRAKFLISTRSLLEGARPELAEIQRDLQVVSCDEPCEGFASGCKLVRLNQGPAPPGGPTLEQLVANESRIDPSQNYAVIQFSSGTTGKPKPIPRTHKNLCHLVASVDHPQLMDLKPGEVIAGSLALTHRPGLWALLASIHSGATLVLWDNLSDVEDALRLIEKHQVTVFSSSLPFLSMLGSVGLTIRHRFQLSSWRHIITSGAKVVNNDLPRALVEAFKLKSFRQCFGMTEAGWVFLIESSLGERNHYLSVGHVVPGMEAIVMDRESLEPLGPEARGEIALRGPQVFPGYLTDQANLFNRADFTPDGWFRTGDQAFYDHLELVHIEGRFKELLIFENNGRFFPNEIESIISEHPAVEGSCVIKIGEASSGHVYDIARAYVTLRRGCSLTEAELVKFISDRSYEVTLEGGVRFLDKFPRLQNGKVDKQGLRGLE